MNTTYLVDVTGVCTPPTIEPDVSSLNETGNTSINASLVEKTTDLKEKFTGLNHRLSSYMDHVKQSEKLLSEREQARQRAEKVLADLQEEQALELKALREELDDRIRQGVLAELKRAELQQELEEITDENATIERDLTERHKRESSLERVLREDRSAVRAAREELTALRQRKSDEADKRRKATEDLLTIKVENATLKERVRSATFKLSAQESKASILNKKLNFTSEEVRKKMAEQTARLHSVTSKNIDIEKRRLEGELESIKAELTKKYEDNLRTYVRRDDHDRLVREKAAVQKNINKADMKLEELNYRLDETEEKMKIQTASPEKALAEEKKRKDKLNKKYLNQIESQEDICRELATYRRLVETLDAEGDILGQTPAKRLRISPKSLQTPMKNSDLLGDVRALPKVKQEANSMLTIEGESTSLRGVTDKTQDCGIM